MRITKIQAKNFRILQNSVMDFDRDLCLLLGRNNTGKTSFMVLIEKFLKIFWRRNAEILNWIIEGHNASDGYGRGKNLPLLLETAMAEEAARQARQSGRKFLSPEIRVTTT